MAQENTKVMEELEDVVEDAANDAVTENEATGNAAENETASNAATEKEASEENAQEAKADTDEDTSSDVEEKEKTEETSDDNKKEKEGFFKTKKKDKRDEQIEELNDRLRRQMAEFDNFRKRTEKEKSQMFDMGARTIVEKVLPVVDNFERGLAAVPEEDKTDAFVDGMDKIYKQLMNELDSVGVKPIEAVGKEFDPEFHNAVMQVENEELESGIVAQELQKGYMYKDTVVRHSMVAVVQ